MSNFSSNTVGKKTNKNYIMKNVLTSILNSLYFLWRDIYG